MKIVGTGLVCLDIIDAENKVRLMNGGTCANVMTVGGAGVGHATRLCGRPLKGAVL